MNEADGRQLVVVGLGNPGRQYENTRHNIGFLVVKKLADKWGLSFKEDRQIHAWVAKGSVKDVTVHLLMPTTFMNNSGQAVRQYLDYFKLTADQMVVAIDDVSLEFGSIRLRPKGTAGGHNGLKSIEELLHTRDYPRLRLGIGKQREQQDLADYVLSKFTAEEMDKLPAFVESAASAIERLLNESIIRVMNTVNRVEKIKPSQEGQENINERNKE